MRKFVQTRRRNQEFQFNLKAGEREEVVGNECIQKTFGNDIITVFQ